MAAPLTSTDLIASYYTLTGAGHGRSPRFSFQDRVIAARAAGFAGIGLLSDDYEAILAQGSSPADLRAFADDHGIVIAEIEFLMGWSGADATRSITTAEARMYEMADTFGSRHLNIGAVEPPGELPPTAHVAERFAAICDRANEHGLLVGLEFIPFVAVSDVIRAWEIVEAADRANGGIVLDAYHFFRGNPDEQALRSVPRDRIVCIQLCDAAPGPPIEALYEETTHHRQLPGEGGFDLHSFLNVLGEMGAQAPRSVEILSDDLWSRPIDEAARAAHDATRAVMTNTDGAIADRRRKDTER